jgi:hypothetical protein
MVRDLLENVDEEFMKGREECLKVEIIKERVVTSSVHLCSPIDTPVQIG